MKQNNKKLKVSKKIEVALIAFFTLLTLGIFSLYPKPEFQKISYPKFQELVKEDRINSVTINYDKDEFYFEKERRDGKTETMMVDNPRYDDFKKDLLEAGIKVEEESSKAGMAVVNTITSLLVPIALFGGLMFFMTKTMNRTESVGVEFDKSKKLTFADVAGLQEVKEDLMGITDFLANPKKYTEVGAKLPKGVLLYGPPGTGKTLLARAVAGEANANFVSVSGSDFSNKFLGVGGDRVRKLFKEAREKQPCIIFIDEIDAVGGDRNNGGVHSETRNTLNALLTEMDGFNTSDGIIVIAATNRLEDLDPALIRPGRFDNVFAVPLPSTQEERKEIVEIYKKGKKFDETVDFEAFTKQMMGHSPAEIETVMNEACILAARKGKAISKADIDEAYLKKILKGHVKINAERDMEQMKLVAFHESGHAIIGTLLGQEATKVTILPSSSGAGGFTLFSPSKLGMYSKRDLENRVRSLYAGRAAEELLVGTEDITTGASNDIEQATTIIRSLVMKYGMFNSENGPTLLDYSNVNGGDKFLIEKMNELANKYYKETVEMLRKHRGILEEMAEQLLEKETLSEAEILSICKK